MSIEKFQKFPAIIAAHGCSPCQAGRILKPLPEESRHAALKCLAGRLRAGRCGDLEPVKDATTYLSWLVSRLMYEQQRTGEPEPMAPTPRRGIVIPFDQGDQDRDDASH